MGLREDIINNPACAEALAARDCDELAGIMSLDRKAIQTRFVTARTVLAECGVNGAVLLDKLDAAGATTSAVKWAMVFLRQDSGLDVGHPATQYLLQALVPGSLTQAEADQLKVLAMLPAPLTVQQIAEAIFNPDGSAK
jgi:hypothetical protein